VPPAWCFDAPLMPVLPHQIYSCLPSLVARSWALVITFPLSIHDSFSSLTSPNLPRSIFGTPLSLTLNSLGSPQVFESLNLRVVYTCTLFPALARYPQRATLFLSLLSCSSSCAIVHCQHVNPFFSIHLARASVNPQCPVTRKLILIR